jgi:pimeloyl-ACP methyl ester carboxylesterase
MVIWSMGQLHPERVLGLIGVNTPFMPRPPIPPVEMLRAAMGPDHYIVHFQTPDDADCRLAKDVRRVFEMLMRRGIKPSDVASAGGIMNLATAVEQGRKLGQPLLTDAELDVFTRAFERTGFSGGIHWYRNLDRNWRLTADAPQVLTAPSLMVTSEHDFALPPALADGMEARVPNLEKAMIQDCGHWTQQEHPAQLNRILIDWLRKTF